MNLIKFYTVCTLILTAHATTLSMRPNYDPLDPTQQQSELPSSQLANDEHADQLWTPHKLVAISPQPSPSKYFALHDLIQSPDTHTADTQELLSTVAHHLSFYPKHLPIPEQSAYDLLLLQLQKPDLSTQARHTFEQLKILLDKARTQ